MQEVNTKPIAKKKCFTIDPLATNHTIFLKLVQSFETNYEMFQEPI